MTDILLVDPDTGSMQTAPHAKLPSEWAEQLEEVMQRDRDFFRQHPEQDYYIRAITPVEVLEGQAMGKVVGEDARVLVGEVIPGNRIRMTILDDLPPPVEEFRAMQQHFRQKLGGKTQALKGRGNPNKKKRPKAKGFG
ncbi:hypothetical protein IQ268_28260 [Oculatella sp. LEGE 06141]|uniref:hypothetical protein n=1 Tax=Oculatella sp. LEGE 06141 TaxID=1828648 RepID=UPI001880F7F9|nr:hypothetical protein [Oculatella sp. LEGE 06141]MBE9182447.1 hypothetical protein [Oculatella sp. LEGE 06141]